MCRCAFLRPRRRMTRWGDGQRTSLAGSHRQRRPRLSAVVRTLGTGKNEVVDLRGVEERSASSRAGARWLQHQGNRLPRGSRGFFEGCALRVRPGSSSTNPRTPQERAKDAVTRLTDRRIRCSSVRIPEAAGLRTGNRCGLGDVQEIAVPGDQHIRPTANR